MEGVARGPFEVTVTPEEEPAENPVGRMSLNKRFHGELEATSTGWMLAVNAEVPGSAGYVAMEWVTGTLGGRSGSFALQHSGTMTRGAPQLTVTVVPDSATDQLQGLEGEMAIEINEGQHFYELTYALPVL